MNKLNHVISIERRTAGADNEYGDPTVTYAEVAEVAASVQPLRIVELAQIGQAGPVTSDHRIFVYPTDIIEADRIRIVPDDGRVFEVDAVPDAAGAHHHLEVLAHLVTA